MILVWKLLRQHISVPQFIGFVFANLVGMLIVLLGYQFYRDVLPVFTAQDSFMKADYLIVSKKLVQQAHCQVEQIHLAVLKLMISLLRNLLKNRQIYVNRV